MLKNIEKMNTYEIIFEALYYENTSLMQRLNTINLKLESTNSEKTSKIKAEILKEKETISNIMVKTSQKRILNNEEKETLKRAIKQYAFELRRENPLKFKKNEAQIKIILYEIET